MINQKEIGDLIKNERIKMGWSLYRLSLNTGVSIRHLHLIENGQYDIRVSTFQKILAACNKKIEITEI